MTPAHRPAKLYQFSSDRALLWLVQPPHGGNKCLIVHDTKVTFGTVAVIRVLSLGWSSVADPWGTAMPKIDIAAVPERKGSGYPPPFDGPCADRIRQRLGNAGGLTDFGINLMRLPPGNWSSQRHWHSHEDEFIYVLEGELTLIEDGGETLLRAGDCAAFAKASGNGHHMINRSGAMAVYLEVGSRAPADLTTCSDIDMMSANADGRFVHKDGTPYPDA